MKLHLVFIGNKFVHNAPLREYVMRKIEQKTDFIHSITFFKESDNSLFLYLDKELNSHKRQIIVTTKQHFSTIGKLLCTVTGDNQILKEDMLIPSNSSVFEDGSYLLEYKDSITNVVHMDEMQKFPEILLDIEDSKATMHLFEEDKESAMAMLLPIAQMYDLKIDIVSLIDEWLQVNVRSKKYGNISKFIASAKQLLPNKLIAASNMPSYIIEKISSCGKKIAFAESCTGGLLTCYFTKHNGVSKIFEGALITYSNNMKENWLGVNGKTLEEYGAVSNEVVAEMSEGAMNVSNADYTISISGIAGEGGGTLYKPVGTVFISVRSKGLHKESRLHLKGDRNYIQQQSVLFAVKMLLLLDKETFF
ncbi:MAG: CinA family protein [Sulfurimonas sp.]|uniref:CinA family protein n=1 Tax=Sulfurimonas sp. TaxID=2022749 RepID=UPI00261D9457|nr:CinA family protein [Sulfurimonas sp.]MDD2652423.1 CinA family protein [Sulfurimonas sp.]MDD3451101.1 CinA family protein [Sulfurimonas sp.]